MLIKDALEKKVGLVVELCGAVWGNFQPRGKYCKVHVTVHENETGFNKADRVT